MDLSWLRLPYHKSWSLLLGSPSAVDQEFSYAASAGFELLALDGMTWLPGPERGLPSKVRDIRRDPY